jgi:serine phosphatase RsbU (regulator of sigma subunit)/ABC-type glycerol-3-phosphate transport system permease component
MKKTLIPKIFEFNSLKTKFAVAITGLILVLLTLLGSFLIRTQSNQIKLQIFQNARSFIELSANNVIESFDIFFLSENHMFFQRDIRQLLSQNTDIQNISVFNFEGTGLYSYLQNTAVDISQERIQSANPSVILENGQVIYINKNSAGEYEYVDSNMKPIETEIKYQTIKNFSYPVVPNYNVVYDFTYKNLAQRVWQSTVVTIFSLLLALCISVYFAFLLAQKVTNPIKELSEVVNKIAEGKLSFRARNQSKDEVGQLSHNVNQMAKDLKKATEAKVYQARVTKELELATTIQNRLLPMFIPQLDGLDVDAQVLSAEEIGGDVYDILKAPNGDDYLYVGDVTGHGVPAGILASVSNALLLNNIEKNSLVDITDMLNEVLVKKSSPNLFITLALIKHTVQKKLSYISAGHEQIIHYHAKTKTTSMLEAGGIAAGLFAGMRSKLVEREINADKDDVLIMYSDGIPEAWLNKTDQYGFDRLQKTLQAACENCSTAKEIKDYIIDDVLKSIKGMPQADDITLMVIKKTA